MANNWLLKDANGKYVPYGHGYSNEYLADIGNRSYQRRFISEMDADMRGHRGVDGVFIDNVIGSLITVRTSTETTPPIDWRCLPSSKRSAQR